jgi:hypothetical protein
VLDVVGADPSSVKYVADTPDPPLSEADSETVTLV